jgi:site-specific DNA-methyltransferase (adenine-specific)
MPRLALAESFYNGRVLLHHGECLSVLAAMPENSFDSCVTDPPYHFSSIIKRFAKTGGADRTASRVGVYTRHARGFMGKTWDGGQIAHEPETWAAVLRVLKPGAHLVAFHAPKNWHRLACAIEDAGFEIRDNLLWLFGSGFPKNKYSLKPAYEPIILARKPLAHGKTIAGNIAEYETGALNIDACRVVAAPGDEPMTAERIPGNRSREFYRTGIPINVRPSTVGRWPANILLDGSKEVADGLPVEAGAGGKASGPTLRGENTSVALNKRRGFQGDPAFHGDSGSAARFFATFPQEQKRGRRPSGFGNIGAEKGDSVPNGPQYQDSGSASRYFYTAKADADDRVGSKHPTIKPLDLMQWLIKLITPPGGMIIDPFAGTGTTGEAALGLGGFRCTLIEREADSIADIRTRMKHACTPNRGKIFRKPKRSASNRGFLND